MRQWVFFSSMIGLYLGGLFWWSDGSWYEALILPPETETNDFPAPFLADPTLQNGLIYAVIGFVFGKLASIGAEAHDLASGVKRNFGSSPYSRFASYFMLGFPVIALGYWFWRIPVHASGIDLDLLMALAQAPFGLLLLIYMLVAPFVMPVFILVLAPFFCIGVYSLVAGRSQVSDVAEKHVELKRPDSEIEQELAEAIKTGQASDRELTTLINEMSPVQRFIHNLTYKKKAEKYREMRELIDAQAKATRERTGLAKSAHELERTRRDG